MVRKARVTLSDDPTAPTTTAAPLDAPSKPRLVVVNVRLRSEQADALGAEAWRRVTARGLRKPDVSEVLREVVDLWLAREG